VSSAKAVEEQGLNASLLEKYSASKYLAETAAWDWMKNKKPAFDLVTILPCYTWGVSEKS
jgi:nucleoside-diphosphate-sugar epimerase